METIKLKKETALWIIVVLLLFITAITLGILMRLNQGEVINQSPYTFYSFLTAHGLTMVGIWFVAGMAAVHYLMQRYVKVKSWPNIVAMVLTVIGILMLWTSTFIGKYHAGWTFLYPLTFKATWDGWAVPLFLWSLVVLVVGWLIWTVGMMAQLLRSYSISETFAWQYLRKKKPEKETPPFILISMITLVGILTCLIAAVIMVVLFFAEFYSGGTFKNDALLMKNLIYFFGHTIANENLYLGLAVVYELFGEVSGRPKWKTTWYIAFGWNCTLVFILTAFFHHMYMDFVQPEGFQIVGQLASYLASLPAAAVTVFSVLLAVYRTKIKWTMTNLLFLIGVAGWISGGLAAVIDATISNNFVLHNTLWVPAHFHSYNVLGAVLFCLAFFNWFSLQFSDKVLKMVSNITIGFLIVGGVGFLTAFFIAGAQSVPRRYNVYPAELTSAPLLAVIGAIFAIVYLIAILLFLSDIGKKCLKILFSRAS